MLRSRASWGMWMMRNILPNRGDVSVSGQPSELTWVGDQRFRLNSRATQTALASKRRATMMAELSLTTAEVMAQAAMFDELGIPDDPLIVDVAAHTGHRSVVYALARPDATIIALEPDPDNFGQLVANTAGFAVSPLNVGAGAEIRFTTPVSSSPSSIPESRTLTPDQFSRVVDDRQHRVHGSGGVARPTKHTVVVALDDLLRGEPPVFINVGTEDSAMTVLSGATEILKSVSPAVQIRTGSTGAGEVGDHLTKFNYKWLQQAPGDGANWVYGP